jgi:exodeoxyribonuclease-3
MKIATYNINGINGRLPRLLDWLAAFQPDVVCLQELKSPTNKFPASAIEKAGYGALWRGENAYNGVAILARDTEPLEVRRELPGDPGDKQSRYLEAAVNGILVGCLYLPNGNPQPGPKFEYKLAWFERLIAHAAELYASKLPIVLAGDFNVVPTDIDIYPTKSWDDDALLQPESKAAYARLIKQGWKDALRVRHPKERIYTYWDYKRNRWPRDAGLRIDHLLLSKPLAARLKNAGVDKLERGKEGASDHAPTWIELTDRD